MNNILEIKNLSVAFQFSGKPVPVTKDVTFSIADGEVLGVVGESGSGKSVTAKTVMRLLASPPSSVLEGSIMLDGHDVLNLTERQMQRIRGNSVAMIFQEPMTSLNPVFTCGDQLVEAILLHQKILHKKAWKQAVEMLDLVGIPMPETRMKAYPHELSGGMQQRVMIAMALACRPKILIADEPTTALDVTIQAQILRLMNDLQRENGTSIIFITHDLGVINEMADDVVVMYCGQVVEQSSARVIFTDCAMSHPYTEGLMNSIPRIDNITHKLEPIPGVVPHPLALPKGCKFAPRCKYATRKCLEEEPPLVEVVPGQKIRCFYPEKEVRNSAEHKKALIDHES